MSRELSHDLNNYLTALTIHKDLLFRSISGMDGLDIQPRVDKMNNLVDRMGQFADDMLNTPLPDIHLRKINLTHTVQSFLRLQTCLEILSPVTFKWTENESDLSAFTDDDIIWVYLAVFAMNARELHSSPVIEISCRRQTDDPWIELSVTMVQALDRMKVMQLKNLKTGTWMGVIALTRLQRIIQTMQPEMEFLNPDSGILSTLVRIPVS